jgi:hypothetical protein
MAADPEAMRREVWELVDSRRRLWDEMLSLRRRHPPGWWWSLDRPDDLRRSLTRLALNLALSGVLVTLLVGAADSVTLRITTSWAWYAADDMAQTRPLKVTTREEAHGLFGRLKQGHSSPWWGPEIWLARQQGYNVVESRSRTIEFLPGSGAVTLSLVAWLWMVYLWASVAVIGLWTQIRPGVPWFAKSGRTVVSASCLESCKLVYLAGLVGLAAGAECVMRLALFDVNSNVYGHIVFGLIIVVIGTGVSSWSGALRSDVTGFLIRNTERAFAILFVYALIMPIVLLAMTFLVVWLCYEAGYFE